MKMLITGGHFTPAVSLISSLQKKCKSEEFSLIFVGRKYQTESEKTLSLEYKEVTDRGIPFVNLETGRFTRALSLKTVEDFFRIPMGFLNALAIIKNERPDIVFSFGGYIALPISFWAYCFRIPIYTHEQTIHPGLANKIIGGMAKKIFVAFEESKKYFDQNKVKVVGNPIRESILKVIDQPFSISTDRPVLYVTGGSLGSHSINEHIFFLLRKLLQKYTIIHQIGNTKEYDDYTKALEIKRSLSFPLKKQYYPRKHFFENEIGYIYSISDLVVGRAGANTFFELCVLKKPTLFIPLQWAASNEQVKHAEIFAQYGTGEVFHQSDSSDHLFEKIEKMINNIEQYKNNFSSLQHLYKKNAADCIVKELFSHD